VAVLRVHNVSTVQALRAVRMVETYREELRDAWSAIHD
jgi:hypothetical protein